MASPGPHRFFSILDLTLTFLLRKAQPAFYHGDRRHIFIRRDSLHSGWNGGCPSVGTHLLPGSVLSTSSETFCFILTKALGSSVQSSAVQLLIPVLLFSKPWIAARQASLSITNSWSLLKLISIKSVMPSNHLMLYCLLLLLSPIPPSIRVFSNESTLLIGGP